MDDEPSQIDYRSLRVLAIDDEKNILATLKVCLEGMGCSFESAVNGEAALNALRRSRYDLAFLDLRLGSESGLDLIPGLLAENADLAIVVVTAYATFETAVEAIRRGAKDYLPKPFTPAQIRHAVRKLAEQRVLARRVADLENLLRQTAPDTELETSSPAMHEALDLLSKAAASDAPVLFRGENGAGKGVMARALHLRSPRSSRPFVTVNCPTLSDELLASELFGHARGAFTGAVRDQVGRVESAEGGTLFLDEIGEISPGLQAKLLRFLQEKQFERIGENKTRRADVRVVAATNRDLEDDVAAGRFREDLLYRINVIEVAIPPLRQRPEDIPHLARHFLAFFARQANRPALTVAPETMSRLQAYAWPGNIRELRNVIERAVIVWQGDELIPEALPQRILGAGKPDLQLGGEYSLDDIEREHITKVLARASTLDEAARILGIDATTLWRKRKKYLGEN